LADLDILQENTVLYAEIYRDLVALVVDKEFVN